MPKYFAMTQAPIRRPAETRMGGRLFSNPRIQSTTAQTHSATIHTSHIKVVLETMNTGVNKAASAA